MAAFHCAAVIPAKAIIFVVESVRGGSIVARQGVGGQPGCQHRNARGVFPLNPGIVKSAAPKAAVTGIQGEIGGRRGVDFGTAWLLGRLDPATFDRDLRSGRPRAADGISAVWDGAEIPRRLFWSVLRRDKTPAIRMRCADE